MPWHLPLKKELKWQRQENIYLPSAYHLPKYSVMLCFQDLMYHISDSIISEIEWDNKGK